MKNSQSNGQLLAGLIIIVIGLFALVGNLSIFNIHNLFQFWPTIFIVIGLIKISKANTLQERLWGGMFIAIGLFMTLNSFGIIHVQIRDLWPVILIVIGVKMLMGSNHKTLFIQKDSLSPSDSNINITASLGGVEGNVTTQDFRGGNVSAFLGGVELDLRQAAIQDKAIIDISVVTGGVVLKVPREWVIENQITAIMGGLQDKSVPTLGADKRLILTGFALMGGIEIKN